MSTEQFDGATNVRRSAPTDGTLGEVVLRAEALST
jgi:hypothetical protein